jgi:hypothetical protein
MKKFIKFRLAHAGDRLLIKLPVHPSTIEELALIRFWLLKLSQINFEHLYAAYDALFCILNPEFLSVLNPRTGTRKILFHTNKVRFGYHKMAIPADLAQFICARLIFLVTPLLDEPHRDKLFRFIMGTGKTLEKFWICADGQNKEEFCELLVNASFYYNSFLIFCFQI